MRGIAVSVLAGCTLIGLSNMRPNTRYDVFFCAGLFLAALGCIIAGV